MRNQTELLRSLDVDDFIRVMKAQNWPGTDGPITEKMRKNALAAMHKARVMMKDEFSHEEITQSRDWLKQNDFRVDETIEEFVAGAGPETLSVLVDTINAALIGGIPLASKLEFHKCGRCNKIHAAALDADAKPLVYFTIDGEQMEELILLYMTGEPKQ